MAARLVDDERGVALALGLAILLLLTGLVLALLSVSGFEPQIASNHARAVRARYVAEAGVEYAYDTLATNLEAWDAFLAGATCGQGAILGTPAASLPGFGSVHGTFTVRLRNDCETGDDRLTGGGLDLTAGRCADAPGTATHDANCRVIVTSTGVVGGTTRTLTVVVSRTGLPPINAALAFPGMKAGMSFGGSRFVIDGRDTRLSDRAGAPTGVGPAVYGITVNGELPALAAQVESALAAGGQGDVRGKDEAAESATTQGPATIRPDGTLTSRAVSEFAAAMRSLADVAINLGSATTPSLDNIGSACATDHRSPACWGTTDRPKIVYLGGPATAGPTPAPPLRLTGDSRGSGVLILENGVVEIDGSFRWNGPIVLTGRDVALRFRGAGGQSVYGALIVNESNDGGSTTSLEGTAPGSAEILYSKEALELVQNGLKRRLVTTHGWTGR
jgi:Tfp pilus assembly protein PilX